ncbi:hypothetical protein ACFC4C_27540 [Streptomyces sp. NPDC056039]|uniref:hypothetical protein n=1 Tax=Streptomyces sp. NPDC056039 TaxID=3345687 RepID=UPI0035E042EE
MADNAQATAVPGWGLELMDAIDTLEFGKGFAPLTDKEFFVKIDAPLVISHEVLEFWTAGDGVRLLRGEAVMAKKSEPERVVRAPFMHIFYLDQEQPVRAIERWEFHLNSADSTALCRPCHQESPDWVDPEQMARWIATREERPRKEVETFLAWLAAAERAPDFNDALATVVAKEGAAERVSELLRSLLGQAGTHFGIGFSRGTRVAVLQAAANQLSTHVQQTSHAAEKP